MPQWQVPSFKVAVEIQSSDRYLRLPSQYDIHEWQIMADFVATVPSPTVRDEFERAIHGRGVFRMFKEVSHRHGMKDQWFDFREKALRKIAIDFCEEHGLAWTYAAPAR